MQAASRGHLKTVEALLAYRANVNHVNIQGETALMKATDNNRVEIVQALIDKGADVDMKTSQGITALHRAVDRKNLEIVRMLLAAGADVHPVATIDADTKLTALKMAVVHKRPDIAKALLFGRDEEVRAGLTREAKLTEEEKTWLDKNVVINPKQGGDSWWSWGGSSSVPEWLTTTDRQAAAMRREAALFPL
jgi:hypothetical protein